MTPPVVLAIAATDSGGAAGLAADLTTFAALGVHGACVVTAVTAQDTTAVHAITALAAEDVAGQIEAVFGDLPVAAIKTGVLGSAETAALVAEITRRHRIPMVVDPVLVSTSGGDLASGEVLDAYRALVIPASTVITPNRTEAARLLGADGSPEEMARALYALGPAVVLTGGHPEGASCTDLLVDHSGNLTELTHPAVQTVNDHGTGCTFSSAIAACLAHGRPLEHAVREAQAFVARALHTSRNWELGRGRGSLAHITHQKEEN